MDFLKKAMDGGHDSNQNQNPSDHSNADLLSSAKLVAEAAQSQFQNKKSDVDKGELAGAAANILDAAQKYGKLDESKGVGQYVEKAEGYLRGYSQSAGEAVKENVGKAEEIVKEGGQSAGEAVGEFAKKGEDFLNNQSSGGSHDGEEGGAGDFLKKAAGDFLKRD